VSILFLDKNYASYFLVYVSGIYKGSHTFYYMSISLNSSMLTEFASTYRSGCIKLEYGTVGGKSLRNKKQYKIAQQCTSDKYGKYNAR
jgi:hypothetical protein